MNSSNLPRMENTRARFLRKVGSETVAGWVVGERDLRLVMESGASHQLAPGEELVGEVLLYHWRLIMRARVAHSLIAEADDPKTIVVLDPIHTNVERGDGRERFRIPSSTVRMSIHGRMVTCRLADASVSGVGIWVPEDLTVGHRMVVELQEGREVYELEGEVRYARADRSGQRLGVELDHTDRVSRSKWERFIADRNRRLRTAA